MVFYTKIETFDGNVQINRYDAEGLRYEMEENGQLVQFIFNTEREVVAEKENEWTIYIRGSELLSSSSDHARTYYHYTSDEMGSIIHIVDDKEILNEYEYDAWGNVVSRKETIKTRFKFNGQQLDPITQQYYLRARFYNPVIARFTQEDTYRGDGLNLYAYCANNPVYYVDPSGNVICKSKYNSLKEKIKNNDPLTDLEREQFEEYEEYINKKFEKWLNKGEKDYKVYFGRKDDKDVYTGITKQPIEDRLYQHNNNIKSPKGFDELRLQIDDLTRNQARSIEQYFIKNGPNQFNSINSIRENRDIYDCAIEWAEKQDVVKNYLKNKGDK